MVWGHLTASVVRDADGNPEFTVGMVHDVSDRKQLEERLYQAQKLDAVGRLAGGVAHDFNNLLTVITVHSGFLLGSLDPRDAGQRADVEAIEQAAQRAASLTQQLLAFGRKQVLQPRIVDLNTIVVDTNKMLRAPDRRRTSRWSPRSARTSGTSRRIPARSSRCSSTSP